MDKRTRALNTAVLVALNLVALGCETSPSADVSFIEGLPADSGNSAGQSDIGFGTDDTLDVVTWNIEEFPKKRRTGAELEHLARVR